MIRPEFREALEKQQQVLVSLWVFFFCGIFIYLWITDFILAKLGSSTAPSEVLRMVLWILGFFDLGTLVWWKKRFLTTEAFLGRSKNYKLLQALQGYRSPLEERAAAVVSSYVTSKIVAFAIVEAIAVYGLVLSIVGRYTLDQYLFSVSSGALLLVEFPFKPRLQGLIGEVEKEEQ